MPDEVPEFDESMMPVDEPEKITDIELDERHLVYGQLRWPDKSERMQAYNVRRVIWAKFLHRRTHPDDPDRKMLGGPQPGAGRKPTKALGAAIVEAAESRRKEIEDAVFSPLARGNDPIDRHKAAMNILKHAREERREDREADEYARKTDEEARREFAQMLAEMIRNGDLSEEDLKNVVDSTAVEIPENRQLAS